MVYGTVHKQNKQEAGNEIKANNEITMMGFNKRLTTVEKVIHIMYGINLALY